MGEHRPASLPDGWTVQRIELLAGGPVALIETTVGARLDGPNGREALRPTTILGFSGLCLVHGDDGDWYMGEQDANGTVVCWSSYGADLAEAIRSL